MAPEEGHGAILTDPAAVDLWTTLHRSSTILLLTTTFVQRPCTRYFDVDQHGQVPLGMPY